MNKLWSQSVEFATSVVKSIPLIFLGSETQFLFGSRAKQRLFQPIDDPYSQHAWVYAAVNSIAMNVSSTPYIFQNDAGPVKNSRWQVLFEQPNAEMGWGQFIESIFTYWHLRGEAIIMLDRQSAFDMPSAMMPADPNQFEPILNKAKNKLIGWKVPDSPTPLEFAPHEILQVKFFNPNDPFRGLSPLAAASQGIVQDSLANRFNMTFFENSGNPGGVVEVPGNLTESQFSRFRSQLKDRHEGVNKSHKMMLLEGGASFKQAQVTQKDMEFLNQKKWNRDEILAVFKVPKMEVGVWDDVNFAIAKVQAREFWLKNLIPKMDMLSWVFWSQLFSTVGGGRTWAEFDTSSVAALQDELETKIDMGFKLWNMGWTAKQINRRLALNMPDNKWQDIAYIPTNIVAIEGDGRPKQVEANNTDPGADPFQQPTTGATPKPKPKELESIDLMNRLKKYFYNQRVRQLKMVESSKLLTIGEQIEIERMVTTTGLPESAVVQIHAAIKYSLQHELGSEQDPTKVKEIIRSVYNKIETKLPDLIALL